MNFLKAFLSITGIVGSVQNGQTTPATGSSLNLVPSHTTNLLPINLYHTPIPPITYNSNSQQHTNLRGGNLFIPDYHKDHINSQLAAVKASKKHSHAKMNTEPPLPTALPDGILTVSYFFDALLSQTASADCIVDFNFPVVRECHKQNIMPIVKHMLDLSTQKVIRVEHKQDFTVTKELVDKDYRMIYKDYVGNRTMVITGLSAAEAEAINPIILTYGEELPTTEAPTTEAPTTEAPTTEAPTTTVPTTEIPTTTIPTTEIPTTIFTTEPASTQITETLQPNTTQTENTTTENNTELESSSQDGTDFTETDTEEPTEPDIIPADKSNVGTIIGSTVGGIVGVGLIGAAAYYGYKKYYGRKNAAHSNIVRANNEYKTRNLVGEIQTQQRKNGQGVALEEVNEEAARNKRKLAKEAADRKLRTQHYYGSQQLTNSSIYYSDSSNQSSRVNSNNSHIPGSVNDNDSPNSNTSAHSTDYLIPIKPPKLEIVRNGLDNLPTVQSGGSYDQTNTDCTNPHSVLNTKNKDQSSVLTVGNKSKKR